MAALDKAGLLAKKPLTRKLVRVGDGEVWMRQLSVAERLRSNKRFAGVADGDTEAVYKAALAQAVMCLDNEDGTPMFADGEIDEAVAELMNHASATVQELVTASAELQGFGKERTKAAVGNSDEIPCDDSSSGSRGISDSAARPVSLSA